jgi:hypothetical protein
MPLPRFEPMTHGRRPHRVSQMQSQALGKRSLSETSGYASDRLASPNPGTGTVLNP